MSNLKGIITKQTFDPVYFEQWAAYNVYLNDGMAPPVGYCSSILTAIVKDTLVFCCLSANDGGLNFTVSLEEYVSGKAKIIKLVPEPDTSEDNCSTTSTITNDKYSGDLSHYTDILGKE